MMISYPTDRASSFSAGLLHSPQQAEVQFPREITPPRTFFAITCSFPGKTHIQSQCSSQHTCSLFLCCAHCTLRRRPSSAVKPRAAAMEAARRMEVIGSHLSASSGALAGSRDSPDDIVIVDAIRTPITRARKVNNSSIPYFLLRSRHILLL